MKTAENTYTWPNEYEDFGKELVREWQVKTLQRRRVLVGKSGAWIHLVDIVMPDYSGFIRRYLSEIENGYQAQL